MAEAIEKVADKVADLVVDDKPAAVPESTSDHEDGDDNDDAVNEGEAVDGEKKKKKKKNKKKKKKGPAVQTEPPRSPLTGSSPPVSSPRARSASTLTRRSSPREQLSIRLPTLRTSERQLKSGPRMTPSTAPTILWTSTGCEPQMRRSGIWIENRLPSTTSGERALKSIEWCESTLETTSRPA